MADMDPLTTMLLTDALRDIEKQFQMNLVMVWQGKDAFGVIANACPVCCAELLYRIADNLAVDGGTCGKHAPRREG